MGYYKEIEPVFKFNKETELYGMCVTMGDYSLNFKNYYGIKRTMITAPSFEDAEKYMWSLVNTAEERCKKAGVEIDKADGWTKDGNGYWARISLVERPAPMQKSIKDDVIHIFLHRAKMLEPVTYRETGKQVYYIEPEERTI